MSDLSDLSKCLICLKKKPSTKNPKIITQHPQKNYLESKAADRILKLDIIKKHILPKKCSECSEIKILNSEKYDEQINLAILYVRVMSCTRFRVNSHSIVA